MHADLSTCRPPAAVSSSPVGRLPRPAGEEGAAFALDAPLTPSAVADLEFLRKRLGRQFAGVHRDLEHGGWYVEIVRLVPEQRPIGGKAVLVDSPRRTWFYGATAAGALARARQAVEDGELELTRRAA